MGVGGVPFPLANENKKYLRTNLRNLWHKNGGKRTYKFY